MQKIINKLKDKGLTISLAESMTGGKLSYEFVKQPGASNVFKGSVVSYSKDMKIKLLNINESIINKYTTVSNEVALSMIKGLKEKIESDIYISITGNAGPTYENNTNELICHVKMLYKKQIYDGFILFESNDRLKNIEDTIELVKDMIDNYII